MSLLSRIAQSRGGAERLVESGLIPSLAECDFIDARPELDQAFVGELYFTSYERVWTLTNVCLFYLLMLRASLTDNGSFLPSATQRYHQLLLPSLQAVAGVIAALGSKHLTAANQARLSLILSSHTFI